MRYLGNKRHLLESIERAASAIGFERGTVCDLFAGSGRVGRHFRSRGSRVLATDLMACSHVFQKVFLELPGPPPFTEYRTAFDLPPPLPAERIASALPADPVAWEATLRVLAHFEELPPEEGMLTRQYSPAGVAGRMYLREENAARCDAMLGELRRAIAANLLTEPETFLLLATIIDAVDRVANISGTYGAYLKKWHGNALADLSLKLPAVVEGPIGCGNLRDASEWIEEVDADFLYIDPPYNQRQYASNYHLLDIVARIPFEPDLSAFEATVYGKTGLVPWREKSSVLCSRRGSECRDAFASILSRARVPRVVISYNEEGIISRAEFEEILAEYAGVARAKLGKVLEEIPYRRFRSDADGRVSSTGAERQYRELPGRERNEVHEWLFSVAKRGAR